MAIWSKLGVTYLQPIIDNLSVTLLIVLLSLLTFTSLCHPCLPLSAVFWLLIMRPKPYKLIFNTALPFPNQIHSSLSHPSLWQWWMTAFTHLSPLHISLPIRLTTHIHTRWLFILLSFHLSPTPPELPSFTLVLSSSHYKISFSSNLTPIPPPSCALFSHSRSPSSSLYPMPLATLCIPHSLFVSISNTVTPIPVLSIHPGWLKRTEYDRGVIVSKGWVGLQYTRQLHEEATWAFFCSLPREKVCMYVSVSL